MVIGTLLAAVMLGVPACADPDPEPASTAGSPAGSAPELSGQLQVEVLARYPHDPEAFTQGLELHDGLLYESTGLHGESDIRIVEPETGEVQQLVSLPEDAFGEGLTIVDDRVWQLTWQEGYAIQYERDTLVEVGRASYDGEGWGICYDEGADHLVMSDGTPQLTFRDPVTFAPTGTVSVTRDGQEQHNINELECVGGQVWANIWLTDEIVRINPDTGQVEAVVDASGLLTPEEIPGTDLLNGIAAIPGTDTFYITGRLWPTVFLVRFVPA
jgi:glutaminyl-peptide cyclotransferase